MQVAFLQKFGNLSGCAELSIWMDITTYLPFGLSFDDFDKFFCILILHAALDFFQSHLP